MKHLLFPATLILVATPPADVSLEFDAEEGTDLTRTFVAEAEYDLESVVFSVDGETVQELEDVERSTESIERIVVTDHLLEVIEGRPTDIERTFVELHQSGTESSGEEESSSTSISPLEGRNVRFLWDDDDEDWFAETNDDEDEIDQDVLDWLAGDMDLLAFLPDDDVEEGDEWDIEADSYLALMWPGGLFGFFDEGMDEADPLSTSINRQFIENLSGEGTATLEEESNEDGLALISVELDIDSWADVENEIEGTEITFEFEIERTITGEILWNLEERRLESASFEADAERVRTDSWVAETEEGDFDVSRADTYSGTITYEVEFETE